MKVILSQDVKKLGKKGDIVEVQEGYGRNFLLPRKLAVLATAQSVNVAKQLEKVEVRIPVRIGEGGKLFGSVTGKDVSEALKKQNIDIDKKKISIKGTVTGTGVYEAVIKVHPAITSTVKVNIVAE